MFGLIIFILVFVLIVVLSVLSGIIGIVRAFFSLFGFGRKSSRGHSGDFIPDRDTSTHKKSKVFAENDGEYVDYEEVK